MTDPTPDRQRGSSWGRWLAGAARPARAETPPPAAPLAQGSGDDLDVTLRWPAGADGPDDDRSDDRSEVGGDDQATPWAEPAPAPSLDQGGAELVPAVPLLPAIAGRVDALDGQLRSLAMRLDVLTSSTAALRTAIGERIDTYAESAAASARRSDDAAEEQRRSTERALGELRRGIDSHSEALRRVGGRVEELAGDVASLLEQARRPEPEPAAPPPAPAKPSVELAAVLGRVTALESQVARILALVEVVVDTMPASAEGSGDDLAQRVADAVAARLESR